nr:adenosine receptor A3-like [Biomphalaria glabrata]
MRDVYDLIFLEKDKPLKNQSFEHLFDEDVIFVHKFFVGVCICYIPLISISNMFVFWGIMLYPGFYNNNNIHLLSLSVADLIVGLFSLPMYVLSYMASTRELIYSHKYACLAWFSSTILGAGCSLMSLFCIALDRYIAVMWPLHYRTYVTVERTAVAMILLWIIMIVLAVLPSLGWNNYDETEQDLFLRCNFYRTLPQFYVRALVIAPSVTSIFVSTVLYVQIIFIIRRQSTVAICREMSQSAKTETIKNSKANVKVTSILMFLFILLWLPYLLIAPFKYYSYASDKFVEIFKCFALLLTFGNSLFNAMAYAFFRAEYRSVYGVMITTFPWHWSCALRDLHRSKRDSVYFLRPSDACSQDRNATMSPELIVNYDCNGPKDGEVSTEVKFDSDRSHTAVATDQEASQTQQSSDKSTATAGSCAGTKSHSSEKSYTPMSIIKSPANTSPTVQPSKGSSKHTIISAVSSFWRFQSEI